MYKRILIVVDQRPVSRAAVLEGASLASAHGAEIFFFTVLPRYTMPVGDAGIFAAVPADEFLQSAKENANRALDEAAEVAKAAGVLWHRSLGSGDDDAKCIIDTAVQRGCDLIVVASEGRNALMRLITGSAVPGLITASPVPVLVCKQRGGDEAHEHAEGLGQASDMKAGSAGLPMQ